jgi:hypothetical protein
MRGRKWRGMKFFRGAGGGGGGGGGGGRGILQFQIGKRKFGGK